MTVKPEWVGKLQMAGGVLPSMIYDPYGLPCGIAAFTTEHAANEFLSGGKCGLGADRIGWGHDLSILGWEFWLIRSVNVILRAYGKELSPPELTESVFKKMPVYVDPRGPHLVKIGKTAYMNLLTLIREHYTKDQIQNFLEWVELKRLHQLSTRTTVGTYQGATIWTGVIRNESVSHEDGLLAAGRELGRRAGIDVLHEHESEDDVIAEALAWMRSEAGAGRFNDEVGAPGRPYDPLSPRSPADLRAWQSGNSEGLAGPSETPVSSPPSA